MKKGWEIKKLGEVCSILNGGTPDTTIKEFWDGENLWITPKDMGKLNSIYVDDTERKITDSGLKNSSAKILPPNSVVLSSRAPIGHLAINTKPISTNQGCKGIVPTEKINTLYLFYFLKNSVQLLNDLGSGTTFKELSGSKLSEVEIPLPPILEQLQIISILDEAFAAIEQAKENVQRNLQNAKELFQSELNSIFTKKGDGWVEKKLNEVFIFKQGIQRDVKLQSEDKKENQVRFLRIIDFTQGNELPRFIDFPGEDYLMNETDIAVVRYGASTGFICQGLKGALANNLFRIISKKENSIDNNFLFYYLTSKVFQNVVKEAMNGAAMPAISFGLINDIPYPLISLNDQKKIVHQLDTLSTETKNLEKIYQKKLEALEELKKSILQKAFSGELTEKKKTTINV